MPELPEVETIKLGLQKYLIGKKITAVDVKLPRMVSGHIEDIIGGAVTQVSRFGKGLVIDLSNNYSIAIHIKLTGQLIYRDDTVTNTKKDIQVPNKFTYVTIHFGKNAALYYCDVRQFGWIKILKTEDVQKLPFFKELGPEPHVFKSQVNEKFLSEEDFLQLCSTYKTAIKVLMMDQKRMSGVGNIYANDSLWCAEIDPRRPANSLVVREVKKLFECLAKVLQKGLEEGGSSELTYVNVLGNKGNYQNHTLIYGKTGKKCPRCGDTIIRIELGGRGTFISEGCQK